MIPIIVIHLLKSNFKKSNLKVSLFNDPGLIPNGKTVKPVSLAINGLFLLRRLKFSLVLGKDKFQRFKI